MPIYMKYADIEGQVTTEGFKKWIELTSVDMTVHRDVVSAGGGRGREAAHPHINDLRITKVLDAASPKLFQESVAGAHDNKVEIKFTTTTKNKIDTYLTLELADCLISSYSVSAQGDGPNPSENLTLNFSKITYKPSMLDAAGTPKTGAVVTYDLLKMAAS
jgi:type VI secretion system secreted protein Hcp